MAYIARGWSIASFLVPLLIGVQVDQAYSLEEIQVIRSMFDSEREVVGFCYDPPDWVWVDEKDAVESIELGLAKYYTEVDGIRAEVYVKEIDGEKHIWTTRDSSTENNLSSLDECPDRPEIV